MLNAKNGRLTLPGGDMDYIRFGSGQKTLVMIPGVGDGLKTVKGLALPFALTYRAFARDFTVYVFSRRVNLAPGTTTRDMAEDANSAMEALGLAHAAIVGISQGGMIAQWLAIDHPDKIRKLVLAVTLSRPNPTVRDVIGRWIDQAKQGNYKGLMLDTAARSYSPKRAKKARRVYSLLGHLGKPTSFDRFCIQAASCVTHDAYALLDRISCPTLVIGGTEDRIVTGEASADIAERIPECQLYLYEGLGHGLYEEAPDFPDRVKAFCR